MQLVERRPWPRDPRYLVGDDGSVIGPSGRMLKRCYASTGYVIYTVAGGAGGRRQRAESAHVMVCETFHGPRPDGYEVAHENNDRTDCRASNLRWDTRAGNFADKIPHGTHLEGEMHPGAKLTEADVLTIRSTYAAGGIGQRALAQRYGVSKPTIMRIVRRKNWDHI